MADQTWALLTYYQLHNNLDKACIDAGIDKLAESKEKHTYAAQVMQATLDSCKFMDLKERTLVDWKNDFENNRGFFSRDERGHHEHTWMLNEEDLVTKFTKWMLGE